MTLNQYPPLTDEERAALNTTATPEHERTRLYGRDLMATADAYAIAADAPGLRKDAATFLANEAIRLHNEGRFALERADHQEDLARKWRPVLETDARDAEYVARQARLDSAGEEANRAEMRATLRDLIDRLAD